MGNQPTSNKTVDVLYSRFQIISKTDNNLALMKEISTGKFLIFKEMFNNDEKQRKRLIHLLESKINKPCPQLIQLVEYLMDKENNLCSNQFRTVLLFEQPRTDLNEWLRQKRKNGKQLTKQDIRKILQNVISALIYLKQLGQPHEQITVKNIFINHSQNIILSDPWLNQGDEIYKKNSLKSVNAPQKLDFINNATLTKYDWFAADLFSLGIVILEVVNQSQVDFYTPNGRQINFELVNQQTQKIKDAQIKSWVQQLLSKNINIRITLADNIIQRITFPNRNKQIQNQPILKPNTVYSTFTTQTQSSKANKPVILLNNKMKQVQVQSNVPIHKDYSYNNLNQVIQYQNQTQKSKPVVTLPINLPQVKHIATSNINKSPHKTLPVNFTGSSFHTKRPVEQSSLKSQNDNFKPFSHSVFPNYTNTNITINNNANLFTDPRLLAYDFSRKPFTQSFQVNTSTNFNNNNGVHMQPINTGSLNNSTESEIKRIVSDIQMEPKGEYLIQYNNLNKKQIEKSESKNMNQSSIINALDNNSMQEINNHNLNNIQNTPARKNTNLHKYNSTIPEVSESADQSPIDNDNNNNNNNGLQQVVVQYQPGSRYQGTQRNGLRHGKGKFYYQDGGYYDGDWKDNKMHGFGKLYYNNLDIAYEGEWVNDEFHGFGKVYNDSPTFLSGSFDFQDFNKVDESWVYYEGMLKNDLKSGKGKIKLSNGEIFEGQFSNDLIDGVGRFYTKNGNMIEGIWRDSKFIKLI